MAFQNTLLRSPALVFISTPAAECESTGLFAITAGSGISMSPDTQTGSSIGA